MAQRSAKSDRRLLGTWRSDRRRTMKEWVWRPEADAAQRKRTAALFGHLIIRYTRQRAYVEFKAKPRSQSYEVLGADSESVVIRHWDPLLEEQRLRQIYFVDDDLYWIVIGRQREWFRRVT